jgi:hypothetical protein
MRSQIDGKQQQQRANIRFVNRSRLAPLPALGHYADCDTIRRGRVNQ